MTQLQVYICVSSKSCCILWDKFSYTNGKEGADSDIFKSFFQTEHRFYYVKQLHYILPLRAKLMIAFALFWITSHGHDMTNHIAVDLRVCDLKYGILLWGRRRNYTDYWLVASHCLNQCWNIVYSIPRKSANWRQFCLGLNVLRMITLPLISHITGSSLVMIVSWRYWPCK